MKSVSQLRISTHQRSVTADQINAINLKVEDCTRLATGANDHAGLPYNESIQSDAKNSLRSMRLRTENGNNNSSNTPPD